MQTSSRVVIAGGGIAGASIAYHLAQLGWREIAVVEQGGLVSGTTSHAPGLVGQIRTSTPLMKMLVYSVGLYRELTAAGVPGYLGEGSLRLASSKARMTQLHQLVEIARATGLDVQLLTPCEAAEQFPLLSLDGVEGALFVPGDGSATAVNLANALVERARAQGVAFYPSTRVLGVEVEGGRVRGVQTSAGRIATEMLVVAAGIWSPRIGQMAGVSLPLTPMQHQYVVTDPLPELVGRTLPNLRDPDKLIYLRQRDQTLVIGGYERSARPFDIDAIPERPDPTVLTFDAEQFEPLLRAAVERIPALASVGFSRQVCGLESFTPDGEFLLGPAPGVRGFWAACGFCAHGVSGAGGVGKVLAEWIVNGDPGLDVAAMALDLFGPTPLDKAAIQRGAVHVYSTYYDLR
jgi:4-methylaminobutanoate oxidase (formaldehyde-forming)